MRVEAKPKTDAKTDAGAKVDATGKPAAGAATPATRRRNHDARTGCDREAAGVAKADPVKPDRKADAKADAAKAVAEAGGQADSSGATRSPPRTS